MLIERLHCLCLKSNLSTEERSAIVALRQEGYTTRELAEKRQTSQKAVFRTLQRYQQSGSYSSLKRSGRPRATSAAEDKFICITSKRDRFNTAPRIREEFRAAKGKEVGIRNTGGDKILYVDGNLNQDIGFYCRFL